jgi:hypothetical protein
VTEDQQNPLQTIVQEISTLSPETISTFLFRNNGQTIANSQTLPENLTKKFVADFANISVQAQAIGGIENFTIQSSECQLAIVSVEDCFLATVSTKQANQEVLKSITQVLVPTVIRLVNQVDFKAKELEEKPYEELALRTSAEAKPSIEPIPEPQIPYEPALPKTPTNQFMVEKISGLLVASDTVRIDGEVVAAWSSLYEGKQFSQVTIEALDGKKTTCKFKALKDAKNAQGIIQIPEKILQTLQTEKGKLVMVKPVIEQKA